MTEDQFELLRDKYVLWERSSREGPMDLRDYNKRAAEALKTLLVEHAGLLNAPHPVPIPDGWVLPGHAMGGDLFIFFNRKWKRADVLRWSDEHQRFETAAGHSTGMNNGYWDVACPLPPAPTIQGGGDE